MIKNAVTVDAVIWKVNTLRRFGFNVGALTTFADVPSTTIQGLLNEEYKPNRRIDRDTCEFVLSIDLDELIDYHLEMVDPKTEVPATGSIRRLRALAHYGVTFPNVVAEMRVKVTFQYLNRIAAGDFFKVSAEHAVEIRRVYRRLIRMRPPEGPCAERVRRMARSKGWFSAMAWDRIDDPRDVPETDELDLCKKVAENPGIKGRPLQDWFFDRYDMSRSSYYALLRKVLAEELIITVGSGNQLGYLSGPAWRTGRSLEDQWL